MQPIRFVQLFLLCVGVAASPATALAQAPDPQALRQEIDQLKTDFETLRRQYEDRLSALEARVAQ